MKAGRKLTIILRRLPGGVLVSEPLRKAFGHERKIVRVEDFQGNLTMFLDLGEHMQSQIFWYGCYSRDILALVHRILKPGMVVIDGGANIGEITMAVAKGVGESGKVFAFEPVKEFAEHLREHVAVNQFHNVEVSECGLSFEPGEAEIFISDAPYRDGTHNDGLGSLFRRENSLGMTNVIPITTLDAFISSNCVDQVDLVKLDIEGSELNALKGGINMLRKFAPALIIEVGEVTCQTAGYEMLDLISFVREFGYSLYKIGRRGRLDPLDRTGLSKFQNLYCTPNPTEAA
jgi:FkbM family methyltransferase